MPLTGSEEPAVPRGGAGCVEQCRKLRPERALEAQLIGSEHRCCRGGHWHCYAACTQIPVLLLVWKPRPREVEGPRLPLAGPLRVPRTL